MFQSYKEKWRGEKKPISSDSLTKTSLFYLELSLVHLKIKLMHFKIKMLMFMLQNVVLLL